MSRRTVPDRIDLAALLDAEPGIRIEVRRGFRVVATDGVDIEETWRADIYRRRFSPSKSWQEIKPEHIVTLTHDTSAAEVLRSLAAIIDNGETPINRSRA